MTGFWGVFLSLVYFVVLFGAILFLAYVSAKILGVKSAGRMRGRHLIVIDSIILGFDKQIYLLKAGERFFLVSSSNKGINLIVPIEDGAIKLSEEEEKEIEENARGQNTKFKNYFEFFMKNSSGKDFSDTLGNKDLDSGKFNQNLNKIKSIFSKINSQENGDEKTK